MPRCAAIALASCSRSNIGIGGGSKRNGKIAVRAPSREATPAGDTPDPPMLSPEDLSQSWRVEAPILCVAGRGRFDGAAANMLAQLLARHGLGARSVGNEAVSRANIGSLDGREVALICVCCWT